MLDYAKILAYAVRNARREKGLTQQQLADLIDIDPRTVMNIENCKGNPKMEVLLPLLRALQIDPMEVVYPELTQNRDTTRRFEILLSSCTAEEMEVLIPICEAALTVLRDREAITIK